MIPSLGSNTKPTPSEDMNSDAGGLMSKFNPLNLAKGMFGGKKSGSKTGDVMGTDRQKLKAAVSKGKDPEFTTISVSDNSPVRRGDSVANIAAKMYNMMNRENLDRTKEVKVEGKLTQQLSAKKEKRHKELLKALTAVPKKKEIEEKVIKKEEIKPSDIVSKKPSLPQAPTVKPTPPQVAAPKPVAPQAVAPKPTPSAVPAAPAAPSAVPAAPIVSAAPAVSTATKVAVGVGLTIAAPASFAAGPLAENIVAHESKVSSPMRREGKRIATKWKNDTEYNAYNKGTNTAADFDEKGESLIDFSKMTILEYLERGSIKDPKNPRKIFAMGRYQIIPDTMKLLVKNLNIDPKKTYLTKETQDYLFATGIIGTKRKKVKEYIEGSSKVSRDEAILELAKEFASIGVPYDVKYKGKLIKKGQSYYGQNVKSTGMALNPPESVGKALDTERVKQIENQKKSPASIPEKGKELDRKSLENKDLKKVSSSSGVSVYNINNTTVAATTSSNQTMITPKSDASRFVQGVTA